MNRFFMTIASVLFPIGLAFAQSTHVDAKGYFYAPTPCELVDGAGDICAAVTVPLAAQFSLEPISASTKKRVAAFRGASNRRGYFSIKVPPGRYKLTVRGVSYRVFGGGRQSVAVPLVPVQSVLSFPSSGGRVVQIPLVKIVSKLN